MAYQRPYDEDALPRFAEPDRPGSNSNPNMQFQPKPASPHATRASQQRYNNNNNNNSNSRNGISPSTNPQYGRAGTILTAPAYNSQPHDLAPRPQQNQRVPSPTYHNAHYSSNAHDRYGMSPPPPPASNAPPIQGNRLSPASRLPPSPAPPPVVNDPSLDQTLLPLFRAVDKNGTGQLSERELSAALVNGDWTAFDPQTVRMMIRMFDSDRSSTIRYKEFCGLWSFLASWRTLFDRFDTDRSGSIDLQEFTAALEAFRYRLSPGFVALLYETYTIKREDRVMSFDLFVQACISLKRMTDVFKKYDTDRDGYISLGFEDFLTEILRQLR